ncbi:MAG: MtrB/PioB family outer membrane beta-barrel protein [Armatimonadota bacterium]|nr:MtrB/PioB family outer membrane beta-barrel protein [Armatimonadota bacterium]
MKLHIICLLCAIALTTCVPAVAQVDMLNGQDDVTDLRMGVYHHDDSGNQSWVREYDGRLFDLGIEQLDTYGYTGGLAYSLGIRDLIIQDEKADLDLSLENAIRLHLGTDALLHRLDRIPAINPFLAGTPAGTPPADGDFFIDLIPNTTQFQIDRRVNDAALSLTPWKGQKVRLLGTWWQEHEDGSRQVLFRSRTLLPGESFPAGIVNRTRYGGALLIDRDTNEGSVGTDLTLGKSSALSYRFSHIRFSDDAGTPVTGAFQPPFPALSRIIQPDTETDVHAVKARSRITDRLYFTGVQISRNRENRTSTLSTLTGLPVARTNAVDIDSTNVALSFLATNSLSLTGRYRKYQLTNLVPPVLDALGFADNQATSRDESALSLDASYTGIRRAFLSASFENRDIDRDQSPIHPLHDDPEDDGFEHPFTSESTNSDIWRLGARYYPSAKLSMSGKWEKWNIDGPEFGGAASDRDSLNLEATYLARDNFALFANYNRWKEHNDEIRVDPVPTATEVLAVDDPLTPGVDESQVSVTFADGSSDILTATEYQELRIAAAGQNFRNNMTTTTIGAWYAPTPKLTLDVNYGLVDAEARTLFVIGSSASAASRLPNLFPDFAPYDAEDHVWSLGLAYAFRPKWRVYGRFTNAKSEGRTLIDLTTGAGADLPVGPVWTPVDITERRYTLGFGYEISPKEELRVDFSVSDWEDGIDSGQSGRFGLIRFAWSHRY